MVRNISTQGQEPRMRAQTPNHNGNVDLSLIHSSFDPLPSKTREAAHNAL